MKKSNQFLTVFGLVTFLMLLYTDFNLAQEYSRIDLSDPYKNYISLPFEPYTVLHLSGTNGYPIEIRYAEDDGLRALRSRTGHIIQRASSDTLFIEYTGTNISQEQSRHTDTPPAIIIEKHTLPEVIATDVHCQIVDFDTDTVYMTIKGRGYTEIQDCHLGSLNVEISHDGHLGFLRQNSVDSLHLAMHNTSVAFLKNVNLRHIEQDLSDSVSIVLSNDVFNTLAQ